MAEVEWEVEAFCRVCLDQAGGSPGSVFRRSSVRLDLFCGLQGEAGLATHTPRPHLMEQPGPVFSFLPFPLHCSWLAPGTESSCWYVATLRGQFSTHMGFSTIRVNVLLALPFCSFLFKCLHFLRFIWAMRNLSFCIRVSHMKSALPSQETD